MLYRPPAEQLELPLAFLPSSGEPTRIPRAKRVFANRGLKLGQVDWVGFDMDYTLAIYRQGEMDRLSVQATVAKLVERGYPKELIDLDYPLDFPIRGLLIDKKHGHILKMDRFKHVQKGYHGMRRLDREELRALYQSKRVRPNTARYHWVDTLYALSEAAIYAKIIDFFESFGHPLDYATLFTDIREAIDEAHRDGTILDQVEADLPRYVERDPLLAATLHKLRSAGKRLFLLTNSRWPFTQKMMTYLLDEAMPEYPSFRHYFDVMVVAATKPAFFQEFRPLLVRAPDGELRPASLPLERGAVYEGGNLHDLERALGVSGDRILYVGDHIYGDILRSKRESAWRTGMVIQEMEVEVNATEACRTEMDQVHELQTRREELEDQLRFYQQRFKDVARRLEDAAMPALEHPMLEAERMRVKRTVERIRGQMRSIDHQVEQLERRIDACFHPYWGSLMKEADDRSSFGDQVEEYACIYTSRVSNFCAYSPLQHFRGGRDRMPHEL
ncbi:MAG: HAD-IG family 5'-nucleotidase [Polyangiaceae bacterium]|nr:HAD-IG family 5'-nucleotidase [Polyangiaceae bacterium]MBK8936074.1 HAD-IG family 5'-nucleotidase [Polyangiaceae bacterium]